MTLRARIALTAAVAVAVAVLLTSVGAYVTTARALTAAVDRSLVQIAEQELQRGGRMPRGGPRPGRFGGPGGVVQVIDPSGTVVAGAGQGADLPVTRQATAVATGERRAHLGTVRVGDVPVRVLTVRAGEGLAAQIARPLGEVAGSLAQLRRRLILGGGLGIALAAGLGLLVARRAVGPVHELTDLAEEVAATNDLSRRIEVDRDDELGRLARTFNGMLAELQRARSAQEQLVADASHELRTPLTSLRTNIEVLADADALTPGERRALIADVVSELDEFGQLVGALVELARGDRPTELRVPVRFDALVEGAAARVHRRGATVTTRTEPTTVLGDDDRLDRLVTNLLDNAVKYAPGAPIDVTLTGGRLTVRDRGPGIPDDDLPHVFDRFYRSPTARSAPGSGLGLAIAEQITRAHGGRVSAANDPRGGAVFTVDLPIVADPQ